MLIALLLSWLLVCLLLDTICIRRLNLESWLLLNTVCRRICVSCIVLELCFCVVFFINQWLGNVVFLVLTVCLFACSAGSTAYDAADTNTDCAKDRQSDSHYDSGDLDLTIFLSSANSHAALDNGTTAWAI